MITNMLPLLSAGNDIEGNAWCCCALPFLLLFIIAVIWGAGTHLGGRH